MNVEIGTDAAQFPEKEYKRGFSLQCVVYHCASVHEQIQWLKLDKKGFLTLTEPKVSIVPNSCLLPPFWKFWKNVEMWSLILAKRAAPAVSDLSHLIKRDPRQFSGGQPESGKRNRPSGKKVWPPEKTRLASSKIEVGLCICENIGWPWEKITGWIAGKIELGSSQNQLAFRLKRVGLQ